MANTTKDTRVVRVAVTQAELASVIGEKAIEIGLIDFTPDRVEVFQALDGFEIVFEKDTV